MVGVRLVLLRLVWLLRWLEQLLLRLEWLLRRL
jgi:hypothetical protein